MKSEMCESSQQNAMPGVLEFNRDQNDGEILTINILQNNEDVERLKQNLRDTFADHNGIQKPEKEAGTLKSNHSQVSLCTSIDSESNCNSLDSQISLEAVKKKLDLNSEKSDALCLSTETLIDNPDTQMPNEIDHSDSVTRTRNFSGPTSSSSSNVNNGVTMVTTDVTSGLLISPVSLTQDVHVQMGEDNKRMSSVLESLDLQLVYIPTTQQLVAQKKVDTANVNGYKCSNGDDQGSETSVTLNANDLNKCSLSDSPSKMSMIHSNSVPGVTILMPGSLDDSRSLSNCETDCLIRVREPDELTCDSSEFVCNFPRINTNESLLRTFTDASSLSSISTGTDFSVSAASLDEGDGTGHCIDTGDGGFIEINLHSRNSFERNKNPSQDSGFEDKSYKPKRKGLSGFLSRNLFSRKSKDSSDGEDTAQGWKLFGKIPPKQAPDKDPHQIKIEYEDCHTLQQKRREENMVASRAKKEDIEVQSTTALILENRPMNLPSKDPEEVERHKREYEAMVEAAKRKELKELKRKKKQMQQQLRQEEQLMAASRTWTREILPNWDTMHQSKKARELWWHGIPTNVRGKVWKLALGNDLNVTPELYEICVSRAADRIKQMDETSDVTGPTETSSEPPSSKESSVELIQLDVSRTFPQLCIFQKGGPYHDLLHSLLGAYACYRPDVGYVQGMSFIAAVLLLNMDVADAFICFANLLNRPCQVAFFRVDEELMKCYFQTYQEFFKENLPALLHHFQKQNLTPDLYLYDWIFTLFARSLPLDVACRVWDIYCRDGEEFLFRTALGILRFHEATLMTLDFIHLAQSLTRLPECDNYDNLFKCIETIQMQVDKKNFSQVFASKRESKDIT